MIFKEVGSLLQLIKQIKLDLMEFKFKNMTKNKDYLILKFKIEDYGINVLLQQL